MPVYTSSDTVDLSARLFFVVMITTPLAAREP